MLFYSELIGKPVTTDTGQYVGKLHDIVFALNDEARISKICIKLRNNKTQHIKIEDFLRFRRSGVIVSPHAVSQDIEVNELYVGKNIQDKQILDTRGNKIVRVNDVVFLPYPTLHVSAVDVGFGAIFRWFRLQHIFARWIHPVLVSWQDVAPLELARGEVVIKQPDISSMRKLSPEDLATHLDKINVRNIKKIIARLDTAYRADVVQNLNINLQSGLFRSLSAQKSADIIRHLDADEAVDALSTLEKSTRIQIIKHLPIETQEKLKHLFSLSKTPIGHLLSNDFCKISSKSTVADALKKLKSFQGSPIDALYIYVVNEQQQIIGVVNILELLTTSSDTYIYACMKTTLVTLHLTTPTKVALNKMKKYKLHVLPVVDSQRTILGTVHWDDVLEETTATSSYPFSL